MCSSRFINVTLKLHLCYILANLQKEHFKISKCSLGLKWQVNEPAGKHADSLF